MGAFDDMMTCDTVGDKSLRVPTFYSSYEDNALLFLLATCIATVFGAIHCIAWSFQFATLQERWVWRISTILVSGVPISIYAIASLFHAFGYEDIPTWMKVDKFFGD